MFITLDTEVAEEIDVQTIDKALSMPHVLCT
jgi:hypothetical protein